MALTSFRLRVWTRFLAPLDEVWRVKTDPDAISAELQPHFFRIADDSRPLLSAVEPPELPVQLGTSFRLYGLVPLAWPTRIEEYEPRRRFTDTCTNALYRHFRHTHLFEETPDGCRYIDDVVFTPALPTQKLAAILTRRTFETRHVNAARLLPSDPQATGVAVLRVEKREGEE